MTHAEAGARAGARPWARLREALALAALIAVCLAARLPHLGTRSYWLDEAFSVWNAAGARPARLLNSTRIVTSPGPQEGAWRPADIMDSVRVTENTPPAYFLLLGFWMRLFGSSATAVRGLSVLAAVAAVSLVPFLVRGVVGSRAAWAGAWLLALSPMHVYYSREARNYALAALIAVPMTAALLGAAWNDSAGRSRRHAWAAYSCWTTLGLYTNYLFAIMLAIHGAVLWLFRRPMRGWGAAAVVSALLFAPWLAYAAGSQASEAVAYREASAATDPAWLSHTLRFGAKLLAYLVLGETGLKMVLVQLAYLSVPLALLIVWSVTNSCRYHKDSTPAQAGMLLLLTAPLFVGGLVSISLATRTWLLVSPRFGVLVLPGLCLALAVGAMLNSKRGPLAAAAMAVLYAGLFFTPTSPIAPRPSEDWRLAAQILTQTGRAGDLVILDGADGIVPLNLYYRGPLPQLALPALDPGKEKAVRDAAGPFDRIWMVTSYFPASAAALARAIPGCVMKWSQECGPGLRVVLYSRAAAARQLPYNEMSPGHGPGARTLTSTAPPAARPGSAEG